MDTSNRTVYICMPVRASDSLNYTCEDEYQRLIPRELTWGTNETSTPNFKYNKRGAIFEGSMMTVCDVTLRTQWAVSSATLESLGKKHGWEVFSVQLSEVKASIQELISAINEKDLTSEAAPSMFAGSPESNNQFPVSTKWTKTVPAMFYTRDSEKEVQGEMIVQFSVTADKRYLRS